MKKALIASILFAIFIITGCGEKVAVIVNGEKITENELNTRLDQVAAMYGYDLEDPENKETAILLKETVLQNLIAEKVVFQAAKELQIKVQEKDIEAEFQNTRNQYETEEEYNNYLEQRKFTEKDLRTFLGNQLLLDKLINELTKDITTTSTDIKKYYDENKSEFYIPEKIKARNIVVKTEEEAEVVIDRLKKGEDFTKLALELSIDPSVKDNEGIIDYFDKNAMLVDEFKEAAFNLKTGEYNKKPVKTIWGYHIIKVEDRTKAKNLPFEEVKEGLENRFLMEEKNEKFMQYVDELIAKAKIENRLTQEIAETDDNQETDNQNNDSTEIQPDQNTAQ